MRVRLAGENKVPQSMQVEHLCTEVPEDSLAFEGGTLVHCSAGGTRIAGDRNLRHMHCFIVSKECKPSTQFN